MKDFIIEYWIQALFAAIVAFITHLYRSFIIQKRRNAEKEEIIRKGVQALLRNSLVAIYNRYTTLGYMPIYEKENFTKLYNEYKLLGGNGVVEQLRDELLDLPIEVHPDCSIK